MIVHLHVYFVEVVITVGHVSLFIVVPKTLRQLLSCCCVSITANEFDRQRCVILVGEK
jgi:hypothetical protein